MSIPSRDLCSPHNTYHEFAYQTPPPNSRVMGIDRAYESIPSPPTSPPPPQNPIARRNYHLTQDGNSKRPVTQLLDSPWTLQPPRLQTQIHNPQGLKDAVNSARHYDGLSATGTKVPSFLPFSGNFILDASFTLPGDADPLLQRVRQLDQSQKAECADLAKQLIYLIEEADHFTYVRQGNGSQLTGLRTVTGWYFHYVCGASKEHFPESNSIGDCRGSIYVSISTERIYIYYTHRDLHDELAPPLTFLSPIDNDDEGEEKFDEEKKQKKKQKKKKVEIEEVLEEEEEEGQKEEVPRVIEQFEEAKEQLEEILPGIIKEEYPKRKIPKLRRKPSIISIPSVSSIESLPIQSPQPLRPETPGRKDSPLLPEFNVLPKVHPIPAGVDGSVRRNYMKLGALRDLVDSWLPEEGLEGDEPQINPFLPLTFRFMAEWFESSMGHPKVQHEIYKMLALESDTGTEGNNNNNNNKPAVVDNADKKQTRGEPLRQTPKNSKPVGKPKPKLTIEVPKSPRRSVREFLKLGSGTILSPIIEDPIKCSPSEKRKNSDKLYSSGEKKKSKTNP